MSGRRNRFLSVRVAAGMAWFVLAVWWIQGSPTAAQEKSVPAPSLGEAAPAAAAADPSVEVLTRGPIHEAFATPVSDAPAPGLVVPKRPPEPIEEQPPEVKPQGDNATWIAGYWSWDDERKDFIWISGVWRVAPPGNRWKPGSWQEAEGGWQWVSGYWMSVTKADVVYLPKPPATLDQGPTSPTPGDAYFWVPGHWQWIAERYVWVPGYWTVSRQGMVFVYPSYYWAPRGWIYCGGYWDFPLERRGLLFAPVYFVAPVARYRPAVCVDVTIVTGSLFCRPAYHHYYFGDYYADHYVAIGIHPWFIYSSPRHGYDPLFCYYRTHYRHDPRWETSLRGWHEYYRAHPGMRPPHTLAEQQRLLADPKVHSRPDFRNLAVGQPVAQLKDSPNAPMKVRPVPDGQRAAIQRSARQASGRRGEPPQMETRGGPDGRGRSGEDGGPGTARQERASLAQQPSFQTGGAKMAGPPGAGWPDQRAASRPYNMRWSQGLQGARSWERDSRSDQPRGKR